MEICIHAEVNNRRSLVLNELALNVIGALEATVQFMSVSVVMRLSKCEVQTIQGCTAIIVNYSVNNLPWGFRERGTYEDALPQSTWQATAM